MTTSWKRRRVHLDWKRCGTQIQLHSDYCENFQKVPYLIFGIVQKKKNTPKKENKKTLPAQNCKLASIKSLKVSMSKC